MDKLVTDLKQNFCLDFDNEELQEIRTATENMLQKFADSVGDFNPLFEVKTLVPCGSMVEGTRHWKFIGSNKEPVIEYDFLAVLKYPSQDEITAIKHCDKFMQVIDENDYLKHYYNMLAAVEPENALQVESIASAFKMDLIRVVEQLCNCVEHEECETNEDPNHISEKQTGCCCDNCIIRKSHGVLQLVKHDKVLSEVPKSTSLVLKWSSNDSKLQAPTNPRGDKFTNLSHVYVLVDLMPSFELLKASNDCDPDSDSQHDCFLVPKQCATNHPTCWKVSHCLSEIQLLQNTSKQHRYAFMVAKFISKCLFTKFHKDGSLPTTNKIKNIALHHIDTCTAEEGECSICVRNILQELSKAYSTQILPDFFLKLNLLAANKAETLPEQNRLWHQNRCKLIGDCFNFVIEYFDTNLQEIGISSAISGLHFIGNTYYTAWKQTEIEPVFAVNKDKLRAALDEILSRISSKADLSLSLSNTPETDDDCYTGLITQLPCPNIHWTKKLRVWEYAAVRNMYAYHKFPCPSPPGKSPGGQENILLQAQMTCDFFSWAHEDQQDWFAKLANSEDPDDIVSALKAVNMGTSVVKIKRK